MKTNHLIPLLLALLTLGACVSPQDEASDCQECNEQQIVIKLASDNAPATRAGRPLTSNQPNQDVDRVMLIVCKVEEGTDNNQIVYTKLLTDWMTSSEIYIDQNDRRGRTDRVRLREEEQLEEGNYKVYAIAYTYKEKDNQTQYKVKTGDDTETNLNDYCVDLAASYTDKTFNENLILSLTNAPGEELFAGSQEFTVYPTGFTTQVVLNRQVAGVYLYVEDIPYYEGLAKLRLIPAADNDGLVLGQFANEDITENDKGKNEVYVMNGTTEASPIKPLCEINLKEWFTDGEITKDGNLVSTENWKQPDYYPEEKYAFKEGSFFGGSFVIPFAASETTTTNSLKIQLVSKNNDTEKIEQEWSVKLPERDLSTDISAWNGTTFTTSSVTESVTNYSLLRNHLYCIGYKSTDKNVDQDIPQSLYDQVDIQLKVIAEWDIIYDMVLEPDSSRQ